METDISVKIRIPLGSVPRKDVFITIIIIIIIIAVVEKKELVNWFTR